MTEKSEKKVMFGVRITPDVLRRFKAAAAWMGQSHSEAIESLMRDYTRKHLKGVKA